MRLRTTAAFLTLEASVALVVLGLASVLAVQVHQEATVWPLRQTVADETEVLFNEMRAAPSRVPCGLAHHDAVAGVWYMPDSLHLAGCWYVDGAPASAPIPPNSDGWRVVYEHPSRSTTSPPLPTAWGTVWGDWFERNVEQLAVADFLTLWDVETGIVAACAALSDITHLETGHVARSVRVVRITGLADSKINHRVSYGAFIKPADFDLFEVELVLDGFTLAPQPLIAPALVVPPRHVVGVTDNPNLFPVQACTPNVL